MLYPFLSYLMCSSSSFLFDITLLSRLKCAQGGVVFESSNGAFYPNDISVIVIGVFYFGKLATCVFCVRDKTVV